MKIVPLEQQYRVVCTAVVYDNHFQIPISLAEGALDAGSQKLRIVVVIDDYADQGIGKASSFGDILSFS